VLKINQQDQGVEKSPSKANWWIKKLKEIFA
jgi:hypothetical protein